TGSIFGYSGSLGTSAQVLGQQVGLHAAAGCVQGSLDGGGCGRGAAAAVVGKVTSVSVQGASTNGIVQGIINAVAGDTATKAMGGSFANGAKSAGFDYVIRNAPAFYEDLVGYGIDMGPGGAAVEKLYEDAS